MTRRAAPADAAAKPASRPTGAGTPRGDPVSAAGRSVRFVPVLGEETQPLQRELGDMGRLAPDVGDTTTLANPEVVGDIRRHVQAEKVARG